MQKFAGAAAIAAVLALSGGAAVAEEWKFAIEEIPGSIMDSYAQEFKKRIETATSGEVTVTIYPLGSLVQLSNNQIGMVISCKPDKPLRPMLRLMRDENGLPFNNLEFLDLMKQTELYIVKALPASTAGIDMDSEV